ncbi:MAG: LamG domain-containing protein [Phycisphaerae bacterium]
MSPQDVPNLISFWPFQPVPAGDHTAVDLTAVGPYPYTLQEMNGPLGRGGEGVFGPAALCIERGQWLCIPREGCPALNLAGRQQVSVVAWVQRRTDNLWQYIACVWDEHNEHRQYALFTSGHKQADGRDLTRTDADHQPHGYVSDVGGATPGCKFCFSYATGATRVEPGRWTMIGFSYNGRALCIYTDGRLDANGACNPFSWDKPLHDAGPHTPDFTVGQRNVPSWANYPVGQPENCVGFGGLLGGLAVYDRGLGPEEFAALYRSTLGDKP